MNKKTELLNLMDVDEICKKIENAVYLDGLQKDLEKIQDYLKFLEEGESIGDEEIDKLTEISDSVNRIKNLIRNRTKEENDLKFIISDLVFGELGDKRSKFKKINKIHSLIYDLNEITIENLVRRYIQKDFDLLVSIEDIINENNGILNIRSLNNLNGVIGKDIKKIYNFDSTIGSGLQQRGKGETLFSLVFNSIKNDLAGGDVKSRDTGKIIEIKSSNNAGITPKSGPPISMEVEEILKVGGKIFNIEELLIGRIQKKSSEMLISKAKICDKKSDEFFNLLKLLTGKNTIEPDDILPILFLFQLNYYSKNLKEFQTLCVFVEDEDFPDRIIFLDSSEETFLTEKNIKTLKLSNLTLKVTASDRAEIYIANKKK
jgi:hypothetical protein